MLSTLQHFNKKYYPHFSDAGGRGGFRLFLRKILSALFAKSDALGRLTDFSDWQE